MGRYNGLSGLVYLIWFTYIESHTGLLVSSTTSNIVRSVVLDKINVFLVDSLHGPDFANISYLNSVKTDLLSLTDVKLYQMPINSSFSLIRRGSGPWPISYTQRGYIKRVCKICII